MALVRLADMDQAVVSDLAKTILLLVEDLRDATLRADLAEASLDAELGRLRDLRERLAFWDEEGAPETARVMDDLAHLIER